MSEFTDSLSAKTSKKTTSFIRESCDYKIFFDCETSGFIPFRNEIIQIGYVLTRSGETLVEREANIVPESSFWSDDAEGIHGLTRDFLFDTGITHRDWCENLIDDLHKAGATKSITSFVCHAMPANENRRKLFDWNMLEAQFELQGLRFELFKYVNWTRNITTMVLKSSELSFYGVQGRSLKHWADRLGVTFNHHNALEDAQVCKMAFDLQVEQGRTIDFDLKRVI